MIESVLNSIKSMLGLEEDYTPFDNELVPLINTVLVALSQIGAVEPGKLITGETETWEDIIGSNRTDIENIKTYIYLKVKDIFDPPSSSAVAEALKNAASEIEWRLGVRVDNGTPYV